MNMRTARQCLRSPFITAHSGCMNTASNSVDSIAQGIRFGADIIEIDVSVTSDGVPVLFHDYAIFFESKSFPIREIGYRELKEYVDGLMRLDEAFEIGDARERLFNLDIKDHEAYKIIADTVIASDMAEKVFVTGCDAKTAYRIKTYVPQIQVLLNAEMEIGNIKNAGSNYDSLMCDICNKAVSNYCCGINIDYRHCKDELVFAARRRGLLVFVWTIDDAKDMKAFLNLGVDSITTNEVETLRNLLIQKKS
ncbi:MAG TPA: glycerophosphodiester phosphodiesterase [Bacillota bacterium]|nr:glycerophosphodiester phosphodiesterase [Bacillota bacterium]